MSAVHAIMFVETCVTTAMALVAVVVSARALYHALTTRVDAFPAADARTKVFWTVVLVLCVLVSGWVLWTMVWAVRVAAVVSIPPHLLFGLIAATVPSVYLADTKPRIEGILANAQSPGRLW
ncbi:DUF2516 family protein [Kytococcus sp. Marseille-QA3725]